MQHGTVHKAFTTTSLAAGMHTFAWEGLDDAGSIVPDGAYSARLTALLSSLTDVNQTETITIKIDTSPPAASIAPPADGTYVRTDFTVMGSITDPGLSEYSLSLSGASFSSIIDQGNQERNNFAFAILSDLSDGPYTLTVKAKDAAENSMEKSISFTVDKTAPLLTLDAVNNGGYYGGQNPVVAVSGTIEEKNLDTFSLRYGFGDSPTEWMAMTSGNAVPDAQPWFNWNVGPNDGVADGTYMISLFVTDKAGASSETQVKTVVDNTLPTAVITSPGEGDIITSVTEIKGTAFDQNLDTYAVDMSAGSCAEAYQWSAIETATTSVQTACSLHGRRFPSTAVIASDYMQPTNQETRLRPRST